MGGTKGYNSYRGRGAKWKIVAAIALVVLLVMNRNNIKNERTAA